MKINNRWMATFAYLVFSFGMSGCTVLAIGAAGAAGGYAVTADGIEGVSEKSYEHIWQAAHQVLEQQGAIEIADKKRGLMTARVDDSKVKLRVEQATRNSVVVRVQARRVWGMFPHMDVAKRIYGMIVHEPGQTKML